MIDLRHMSENFSGYRIDGVLSSRAINPVFVLPGSPTFHLNS